MLTGLTTENTVDSIFISEMKEVRGLVGVLQGLEKFEDDDAFADSFCCFCFINL